MDVSKISAATAVSRRGFLRTAVAGPAVGIASAQAVTFQAQPIYLADMSLCRPATALSRVPHHRQWRLIEYEGDAIHGTMIVAGENTDAPELRLSLGHSGWHSIFVGIYPFHVDHIFQYDRDEADDEFRVELHLSGESTATLLTHRGSPRGRIDEFFWKSADITGQDLVLRQFQKQLFPETASASGRVGSSCWIAYIKLVPLSANEVQAREKELHSQPHRRLYAHSDGFDYHYYLRPTSEADIRRELEPYRDTDFSRIYWEAAHGEICNYPTKIGRTHRREWIDDHYSVGDRLSAESWTILRAKNIDPFRVALDYAHEIGLEVHASMRTAAFHFDAPWDQWSAGGVYDKHPEWRSVDRHGRQSPRLSYAHPEAQRYVISILEEIAGYPVDGICLLYNRRWPVVEYEPALVDSFLKLYGQDPRNIDERDPRWLAHRATVLTGFMQAVRQSMDDLAAKQKRSKRIPVSAVVATSEQENMFYGMDVKTWARRGLVDTLIPEGRKGGEEGKIDPNDVGFFVNSVRNTSCEVAWNLLPRQLTQEQYRSSASRLYEMGVERLFFWDANQRTYRYPQWTDVRRLGHREELDAWMRAGQPPIDPPGVALRRLGDWTIGYADAG